MRGVEPNCDYLWALAKNEDGEAPQPHHPAPLLQRL